MRLPSDRRRRRLTSLFRAAACRLTSHLAGSALACLITSSRQHFGCGCDMPARLTAASPLSISLYFLFLYRFLAAGCRAHLSASLPPAPRLPLLHHAAMLLLPAVCSTADAPRRFFRWRAAPCCCSPLASLHNIRQRIWRMAEGGRCGGRAGMVGGAGRHSAEGH